MSQVHQGNESVVVTPSHDVISAYSQELRKIIFSVIKKGEKNIVLDLSNVEAIDSTGLGVLISTQNTLQEIDGELVVINVTADILRLFKIMRLDRHFKAVERQVSS